MKVKVENIQTYSVIEKLIQNYHRQNPCKRKEYFFSKPKQIRDRFQLSAKGSEISKDSILALMDKSVNTNASELSFYFKNYNNSAAILDAINFGSQVTCGYNPDFKESGVMSIQNKLGRQIIPIYAVPKINKNLLKTIGTEDNNLVLESGKYYSFKAKNGNCHGWTVNEGRIGWAQSESL